MTISARRAPRRARLRHSTLERLEVRALLTGGVGADDVVLPDDAVAEEAVEVATAEPAADAEADSAAIDPELADQVWMEQAVDTESALPASDVDPEPADTEPMMPDPGEAVDTEPMMPDPGETEEPAEAVDTEPMMPDPGETEEPGEAVVAEPMMPDPAETAEPADGGHASDCSGEAELPLILIPPGEDFWSEWFPGSVTNNSEDPVTVWFSDENLPGAGVLFTLDPGESTPGAYDFADYVLVDGVWYRVGTNDAVVLESGVYVERETVTIGPIMVPLHPQSNNPDDWGWSLTYEEYYTIITIVYINPIIMTLP